MSRLFSASSSFPQKAEGSATILPSRFFSVEGFYRFGSAPLFFPYPAPPAILPFFSAQIFSGRKLTAIELLSFLFIELHDKANADFPLLRNQHKAHAGASSLPLHQQRI